MAYLHLTQTVADAFNALADEVQILSDRKTILEHKLRFAHEQVSFEKSLFFLAFFFLVSISIFLVQMYIPCICRRTQSNWPGPVFRDTQHDEIS